jgi:hypothetical protein
MSSRNKRTRKPKANAVKSKRHPRKRPAPHGTRPARDHAAEPAPQIEPAKVAREETREELPPGERSHEGGSAEARWAFDDPEATWWDDVWPFKDDTAATEASAAERRRLKLRTVAPPGHEPASADAPEDSFPGDDGDPPLGPGLVPRITVVADPSPWEPAEGSARSRWAGWVAALVACAAVVWLVAWLAAGTGPEEPTRLTHAKAYGAPVPLRPDTSFVRTRVLPSGVLKVTHWINSRHPLSAVHLSMPQMLGLQTRAISVSHVFMASDGLPTPTTASIGPNGTRSVQLPRTHRLYISYRLSGVLETSPGSGHRALARITALDVSTSTRLVETTRAVVGAKVLALACTPGAPRAIATPCGSDDGGTWKVRFGARQQQSRVMAQIDLS